MVKQVQCDTPCPSQRMFAKVCQSVHTLKHTAALGFNLTTPLLFFYNGTERATEGKKERKTNMSVVYIFCQYQTHMLKTYA